MFYLSGSCCSNCIIFTVKDPKVYVPGVTLLSRDNKKLTKLLTKGFERLVYWNEYKTKSVNRNMANEYIFSQIKCCWS